MKKFIALLLTIPMLLIPVNTVFAAEESNLDSIPNEMVYIKPDNDSQTVVISNDSIGFLYELEFTKDTVYSTDYLNIRQRPTTLSDVKTVVCPGHQFYRVAHSDFGWDLVMEGEEYFFVWNEYLSSEEPEVTDTTSIATEDYNPHLDVSCNCIYSPSEFQYAGVIYYGDYKWTWYSERILPGSGLNIPGRYTDENGYVCDGDGFICLASSDLPKGTAVSTPFGKAGKVYDSGCASGTLDVYVNW